MWVCESRLLLFVNCGETTMVIASISKEYFLMFMTDTLSSQECSLIFTLLTVSKDITPIVLPLLAVYAHQAHLSARGLFIVFWRK